MAGPQRPRPNRWSRPRNVVLALVAVALVLAAWAVAWALTARPIITAAPAERVRAISAGAQPPGRNAWPLIEQMTVLYKDAAAEIEARPSLSVDETTRFAYVRVFGANETDDRIASRQSLAALLQEVGAWALLAEAADRPNTVRPWTHRPAEPLLATLLPDIAVMRRIAQLRLAAMHVALAEGRTDAAVEALAQAAFVARAYGHGACMVEHLTALAVEGAVCDQVRAAINGGGLDRPALQALLDVLRRQMRLGPVSLAFEGERQCSLDVIQRVYSDDGEGDGRLLVAELDDLNDPWVGRMPRLSSLRGRAVPRILNVTGLLFASRAATTQRLDKFWEQMIRQSRMSRTQRLADPFHPEAFVESLGSRHPIVSSLIPSAEKALTSRDVNRSVLRGTTLVLAVELYRADTGRVPQSLEQLVPGYLDAVPVDQLTGEPFIYRPTAEDDYLLYSVGLDGTDDGGIARQDNPGAALGPRGAGLDFILRSP